ncbi:2,3-bisphosphoglycerate-dependent phosphoglycerate mutase [Clavibacter michiganensis]|uniref:2,3-bisphosphoglycerate-dependent phosphoglycerate mutase n=1 Tax=Clavibacter michiganensis TaxID=28447 RepID=A0A251XYL3_9MICO|nr:2,3-bisphosphoglycerate-dependent phosphoglycerate mutase [Clavibacter michiganensis]
MTGMNPATARRLARDDVSPMHAEVDAAIARAEIPGTPEWQEKVRGRIVMVRHGQTEWSVNGRHTGTTDIPLTETGEEQARAVGEVLAGTEFGLVLASPRSRALRTAELIGYRDQAEVDDRLVEFDYGAYEGRTTADIQSERGHWDLWTDGVPAGDTPGETSGQVRARVLDVLARVLPVLESGQDVLLVAHAHVIRALAVAWVGLPAEAGGILTLSTSTLSELGFEHGRHAIMRWNCPATGWAPSPVGGSR